MLSVNINENIYTHTYVHFFIKMWVRVVDVCLFFKNLLISTVCSLYL